MYLLKRFGIGSCHVAPFVPATWCRDRNTSLVFLNMNAFITPKLALAIPFHDHPDFHMSSLFADWLWQLLRSMISISVLVSGFEPAYLSCLIMSKIIRSVHTAHLILSILVRGQNWFKFTLKLAHKICLNLLVISETSKSGDWFYTNRARMRSTCDTLHRALESCSISTPQPAIQQPSSNHQSTSR